MRLRLLIAAMGILAIGTGFTVQRTQMTLILPEATEVVAPCCQPLPEQAGSELGKDRPGRLWTPPEGEFLPEEEMERIRERNRWSNDAPVADAAPLEAEALAPSAAAPTLKDKIAGLNQSTAMQESPKFLWVSSPPDTIIAVTPTKIVQGVNGALLLVDRNSAARQTQDVNKHFGVTLTDTGNESLFDPKVLYDPESGRVFIVELFQISKAKASFIYLSVSRGDPSSLTSGWCNYKIKSKVGPTWADYEGVGFNRKFFVITSNNFKFKGGYKAPYAWVADKQALVDNVGACPKVKFSRFKLSGKEFTVQPAPDLDDSSPDALYMVSNECCRTSTQRYVLWRVTDNARGSARGDTTIESVDLTGDTYGVQPDAPQKNSDLDLDTAGSRITQAVFRDGVVYATHSTVCQQGPAPNESCVRTIEIQTSDPLAASTIARQATLGAGRNKYVWWPGISVNAVGDVVSVAQFSGTKRFLSTVYSVRPAASSKFPKYKLLAKGTRVSDCVGGEFNRTGDYVGVAVDPNNDSWFVIGGQFADKSVNTFDNGCEWNTRIGVLR